MDRDIEIILDMMGVLPPVGELEELAEEVKLDEEDALLALSRNPFDENGELLF
jgi:hypothetical protein